MMLNSNNNNIKLFSEALVEYLTCKLFIKNSRFACAFSIKDLTTT